MITPEEIIAFARKAVDEPHVLDFISSVVDVAEKLAKDVTAEERERCAKLAASVISKEENETWPQRIAAVIRSAPR